MTDEKIEVFRERLQPRLRDYLKAAHVELSEDEITTTCPICGDLAGLMKDDTWLCMHCDRRGDLLDYVLCQHPRMTPAEAVRHIQRTLGERITELDAVNANELMDMEFQPTGWLIEKLLGKGVYLLAGASKIGKSWLVLWLADRVSKGEKVWDFKTAQCDVLYVSLEDTAQRIQRRLSEVTGGEADRVWIATEAELLGSGFEQQLGNFLTAHPGVGFVIIDTLQRIRQMKSEKYSYSGDYEVMTALKSIADRFNITILVVHHTRKEESEDAFNMISGTNGLMGCADGAMVLQKPSRIGKTATLEGGAARRRGQTPRCRTAAGVRMPGMAGHAHRTGERALSRAARGHQAAFFDPQAERQQPGPGPAIRRSVPIPSHKGFPRNHPFALGLMMTL